MLKIQNHRQFLAVCLKKCFLEFATIVGSCEARLQITEICVRPGLNFWAGVTRFLGPTSLNAWRIDAPDMLGTPMMHLMCWLFRKRMLSLLHARPFQSHHREPV